ncbi:hypothetical protein GH983_24005 (plasmid) [Agrobacterium sp. MA01]|uniref:O-antigen ligase family protein n=1 Tax=Agrobacterium sp. MA01 TaxID=2664893 RepID=UPI00129BC4D2|nr:O-antigen ligase family protein [Agrobacterium sp. MA01]QGG93579.1 hypothetical protein GH983_24005 [Agrobacterium sp. MA01]
MTRPQVNTVSMWIVSATVALTPLALGGNRPLLWPILLAVLSLTLLFNAASLLRLGVAPAVTLSSYRLEIAFVTLFILFALLQIVPVGGMEGLGQYGLPDAITLSVAPNETLLAITTWLNVFILGYLVIQFTRNEQRSIEFLTIIFWIVVAHAALGFVLFHEFEDGTIFGPKWAYLGSMTGAFVNRNTFATFLASGAVVGVALVLRDFAKSGSGLLGAAASSKSVLFNILGIFLIMAVLFGTGSRMGLFVGFLGIILTISLVVPRQIAEGRRLPRVLSIIVFAVIALALVLWAYGAQTIERLGSVERSADVRFALYEQTWAMIMARPWTGFGGGAYELAFPLFHQPDVSVDLLWQKAHNSYLGLWADYGLIFGSLPWLVLLMLVSRMFVAVWSRSAPDYAAIASIVVAIVAMIHATVDFSLEIQGYALLFSAIMGTGAARIAVNQRQSR